jgi:hypothetical protein
MSAAAAVVGEMQFWLDGYRRTSPENRTPAHVEMFRDRLYRFADELLVALSIDEMDVDEDAFMQLLEFIEGLD